MPTTDRSVPDPVPATLVPARAAGSPDTIAPDGSEVRFLLAAHNGVTRASIVEITIQAGQVSRPVRHRTVEEAWYVLEGHGRVWRQAPGTDAGTIAEVGPGDSLAIPLGWAFQFGANDDAPMRFLCVTMPPWPGEDEATLLRFPDVEIRVYADARMAEARRWAPEARHPALQDLRRGMGRELHDRWGMNIMLNKWLEYCLERGHRFG